MLYKITNKKLKIWYYKVIWINYYFKKLYQYYNKMNKKHYKYNKKLIK